MTDPTTEPTQNCDHDVIVIGGGPAGCSAGAFCAREGLDTDLGCILHGPAHPTQYLMTPEWPTQCP